jgi:hypothetical protein
MKTIEQMWAELKDGEFFFVPLLDAVEGKKKCLLGGYDPTKNPPEARIGTYRGMHGVMCYRKKPFKGGRPKQSL